MTPERILAAKALIDASAKASEAARSLFTDDDCGDGFALGDLRSALDKIAVAEKALIAPAEAMLQVAEVRLLRKIETIQAIHDVCCRNENRGQVIASDVLILIEEDARREGRAT